MDYEKAYKEALNRAKLFKDNPEKVVIEKYKGSIHMSEYIFPELRESEDVKIKKELINWFKDFPDKIWRGHDKEDVIAWLEKNGEQPSSQTNERAWLYLVSDVLTWKDGIGQYLDDPRVQELAKKLSSEYTQKLCNSVQDAPNEQKPSEWSEEDERIRRVIRGWIYTRPASFFDGISKEKMVAWIEKQGEKKSTDKIQIGKEYKCIASPRYSTFMRGKIYKPEDKFLCSFMNFCSDCFEPIEDSESKFKVGDWVVTTYGEVSQVISVDKVCDGYTLDNNNYFSGTWCDMYHLWTIDDAKDGDVLVDCNKDEAILMFRGIGNTEWDDVIDYHCYYSCFRKAFCVQKGVEYWGNTNDHNLKPATKEQRDLFFQKMKKTGYEWDSENKEIKKISK